MTVVQRGVLTDETRAELAGLSKGRTVNGTVATRARIVLWWDEGRPAREIIALSGMSEPTVRLWLNGMKRKASLAFSEDLIQERDGSMTGGPGPDSGPVPVVPATGARGDALVVPTAGPLPPTGGDHCVSRVRG